MAIKYVMGLFKDEDQAVEAIHALKKSDWPLHRTHSPIPSTPKGSRMMVIKLMLRTS